METTTISARVKEETKTFFDENSLQSSGSLSMLLIEAFPQMYKATIHKAKEMFSRDELMLIIDVHNGYALTPGMISEFWWHIAEGIKYDNLAEKWNINKDEIIKKAQSLSVPESFILTVWANGFWYSKKSQDAKPNNDIEAYVSK